MYFPPIELVHYFGRANYILGANILRKREAGKKALPRALPRAFQERILIDQGQAAWDPFWDISGQSSIAFGCGSWLRDSIMGSYHGNHFIRLGQMFCTYVLYIGRMCIPYVISRIRSPELSIESAWYCTYIGLQHHGAWCHAPT